MRIAHVATVDVSLKALLRPQVAHLCAQGYDVEMIASVGPHTEALREAGFTVRNVRISRRIDPVGDAISTLCLARLFRAQRYDLVHTHTSKAGFVGRLAARLAGVPMVAHTAHGFFFHENMSPAQRRVFEGIERLAGRWTDMLFLQSPEDYEYVKQSRLVPPDRARWLGNGVELARFDPTGFDRSAVLEPLRRSLFGDGDYFIVLMVASMIERKGHVFLIRALSLLRSCLKRS
jgi:glycosyltransferase involved in cell wall biosynthesis